MKNLLLNKLTLIHVSLSNFEAALRFVIALVIANLPFWWMETSIFMNRAVINIDLALVLCIFSNFPIISIILLAIIWATEWIVISTITFHFLSISEFVRHISHLRMLDVSGFIKWQTVIWIVVFICTVSLLVLITRRQKKLWRMGIFLSLVLIILDTINGSSLLSSRSTLHYPINLSGSTLSTVAISMTQSGENKKLYKLPKEETVQALIDIPAWAAANPDRGILFVIVESLGVPQDSVTREWVESQWLDPNLTQNFKVSSANVLFKGSTTSGELRSLCMLGGSYENVDTVEGYSCIPSQLKSIGWSTLGMHGFSGLMFNRVNWWPKIGLQEVFFGEQAEFNAIRCGTVFRGGCDTTLLANGVKAIAPSRFVYLLTLNTHLPIERPVKGTPFPASCESPEANSEACDQIAATTSVLRQLSQELKKLPVKPLVVVIGDHAPPFSSKLSRAAFLANHVPAVLLVPR